MFPNILACFYGAGAQLIAMFFTSLIAIIIFTYCKTEWRTSIYSIAMVIFALYGYLNGYVTSRMLKFFGTTDWNFSNTGRMAILASRHERFSMGLKTPTMPATFSSEGSMIMVKPLV